MLLSIPSVDWSHWQHMSEIKVGQCSQRIPQDKFSFDNELILAPNDSMCVHKVDSPSFLPLCSYIDV